MITIGWVNKQPANFECEKPQPTAKSLNASAISYLNFGNPNSNLMVANPDLMYLVKRKGTKAITELELKKATIISDLVPYYPSNWISNYRSVEISSSGKGVEKMASSANDILSAEQKSLLNSATNGNVIAIKVKHIIKNDITLEMENREMKIVFSVVPDIEAEYIGGYDQMINYLQEISKDKISVKYFDGIQQATVIFTVNEKGKTEQVSLSTSTGNAEVDTFLIELIGDMPNWKPAKNINGSPVKQEFEFVVGLAGC